MIRARHDRWARAVFRPVIEGLLRMNFSHFYSTNNAPELDPSGSVLLLPNHFSWWDGFFVYHLLYPMRRRKVNLMMLEQQLRRYWYFRNLGAYSIDPGSRSGVFETLNYTSGLLENPSQIAVVYPQGGIESITKNPVTLQRGIASILGGVQNPVSVLPVFFRVEYHEKMRPEVWFSYGNVYSGREITDNFQAFATDFNSGIMKLKHIVEERLFQYDCFSGRNRPQWSINF